MPKNETRFQREIVPHLDSAYNLARWITGNDADAEDALQEAALRAFRFLRDLRSGEAKAWFLQIVRNSSYSCLKKKSAYVPLDEVQEAADPAPDAESKMLSQANAAAMHAALQRLTPEYREVLILRELEELSYREIAHITETPEGTVMSRLARARAKFKKEVK